MGTAQASPRHQAGHADAASGVEYKLDTTRRAMQDFFLVRGVLSGLLAGAIALTLMGLLDFYWPLAGGVRAALFVGVLGLVAAMAVRLIWRLRQWNADQAARAVEETFPDLGQRVRTSREYAHPDSHTALASSEMVGALFQDTVQKVQGKDFTRVVRWPRIIPWGTALGLLVATVLALLLAVPEGWITLGRVLLLPVHYTNIEWRSEGEPLPRGSDVVLTAEVQGRPLKNVELWYRPLESQEEWQKRPMLPPGQSDDAESASLVGKIETTLEDCQASLEYKLVGGPQELAPRQLVILQPLELVSSEATVTPPSYTKQPPETMEGQAVTAWEGSHITWEWTLSRPPATARFQSPGTTPEQENAADPNAPEIQIDGEKLRIDWFAAKETQQFELVAEAEDGMSWHSLPFQLEVRPDEKPRIRFLGLPEQIEATPTTEIRLSLEAKDDFGLSKLGIAYRVDDGPEKVLWEADCRESPPAVAHVPLLLLEEHALSMDSAVTYHAYAVDQRDEPRTTKTDLRYIDIRPYKREYQFAESGGGGGGSGGSSLTLEELIARQRHNLNRTFAFSEDPQVPARLMERLARHQREIMEATREFTSGWERQFGSVPSLHEAATAMEEAAISLEGQDLPGSLPPERAAIAGLIRARRNMRKLLSQGGGGSLAQAQSYDAEMRQNLRPLSQDAPGPEAAATELARDMNKLAQQQREWSQQVSPPGGGGPQIEGQPGISQPASSGMQQQRSQQQAASQTADELRERLAESEFGSQASDKEMEQAANELGQSLEALQQQEAERAAQEAQDAAERLARMAEHLQGLHGTDFSSRLQAAQSEAERLATEQDELEASLESSPTDDLQTLAEKQTELARQAELLAERLQRLREDSVTEEGHLFDALTSLDPANALGNVVQAMQSASGALQSGDEVRATEVMRRATESLERLAEALSELRRDQMQPRLEELLAAEELAARLLEQAGGDAAAQSQARAGRPQLDRMLDALGMGSSPMGNPQESPLAESNTATPSSSQSGSSTGEAGLPGLEPGFHHPQWNSVDELRQVVSSLQQEIQKVTLLRAMLDSDMPIPANYRPLVEEYYRRLSDDL